MNDLLLTLGLISVVAALDAWGRTRRPAPPVTPRRNYDVLAPAAPRLGATRAAHDATVAGIWGPTWLIIRDERGTPDGRQ